MSERCELAELPVGARAIVRAVTCGRAVRRRLLELGLLPGTQVEVVRRAPLGDPLELRLRGYALSIRRDEASAVQVELVSTSVPVPARDETRAAEEQPT